MKECFRSFLVKYVNLVNKNLTKILKNDEEFAKHFNFNGKKLPFHWKAMKKIEKQNNIPINVFGYDDERPYHIYTLKETLKNPIMS